MLGDRLKEGIRREPQRRCCFIVARQPGRARLLCDALSLPQSIAPMPHLCAKLAELTAHEETDSVQLVRLVQSDPVVAGEIMRVANSAALRPRNAIASLQQAVSWLGVATVRNITVATVLHGEVFSAPGHEPEAEELWREAWLGGLWAKEIARLRRKHVETAFLAGLMHRAGAALALKLFSRFERERRTALDMQTFRSLVVEFEAPCGRLLMSNWCIPSEIQEAASEWRSFRSVARSRSGRHRQCGASACATYLAPATAQRRIRARPTRYSNSSAYSRMSASWSSSSSIGCVRSRACRSE